MCNLLGLILVQCMSPYNASKVGNCPQKDIWNTANDLLSNEHIQKDRIYLWWITEALHVAIVADTIWRLLNCYVSRSRYDTFYEKHLQSNLEWLHAMIKVKDETGDVSQTSIDLQEKAKMILPNIAIALQAHLTS